MGELYYHRSKDMTIYCMPCYEPRRRQWLEARDSGSRRAALLGDLKRRKWSARELQRKYGPSYIKWIRMLRAEGQPIWRVRKGMSVLYFFEES